MKYKIRSIYICVRCAGFSTRKIGDFIPASGTFYNANDAYKFAELYNRDPHPYAPSCKCTVEVIEVAE